jgi:SAM-dependent methyltransferase
VAGEVHRLPRGASVLDLGAGEGRTALSVAREIDGRATLVDFSSEALAAARALAAEWEVECTAVEADLRTWVPERTYDVVLCTFVQLLPGERPRLYRLLRDSVAADGWILGEWFRPAHLGGGYDRMGPSQPDRMVPLAELRAHLGAEPSARCTTADVTLDEGPFLCGRAALSRLCVSGRSGS